MKFSVVIGNPPYGVGGILAMNFVAKSTEVSPYVKYVLPASANRETSLNRVPLTHRCVESRDLPFDTFPRSIKTVVQTWEESSEINTCSSIHYSHPDLEFLPPASKHLANVFVGIKGGGPGGVVKVKDFQHYSSDHHFIRCSESTKHRLLDIAPLVRAEAVKCQNPSMGKNVLIGIYIKNYGLPSGVEEFFS